ncbi:hypothetical protein ZWY2020_013662 [Hordeum vulgare]|nr:hypothetical protein ZWY2020_013662 [Hordeum vulgare]
MQSYTAYLSYFWANDALTRDALGIKDGTVDEWVRCHSGDLPYAVDIGSSIRYHRNVTANGYRALVYIMVLSAERLNLAGICIGVGSGDHDAVVPHLGTQAWVRSLGFPIVDQWRAWHLDDQSAGFVVIA